MGIIVKPTAYITWIPKGDIFFKPTDAYITWLPLGTVHIKLQIAAAWVPMGKIHLKPQIVGSFTPDTIQRVKADTKRRIGKVTSATGDTARQTGTETVTFADTKRAVGTAAFASGDTNRRVGEHQSILGDSLHHPYLPVGVFVRPTAYISWLSMGEVVIKPQIAASWVPMGKIHIKPQIIASFVTPWQWQTTVKADALRKVTQANDVSADTHREIKSTNTMAADTPERITYHAPIGYGWYATTVYEDGERVGSSLSQGAPGGKASQYTIDRVNLGFGSHYSSYYDEDDSFVPFSSLIDTEFPVLGEEYLWILTKAIEWLNRKTQETVTTEITDNISNGAPEINHILDFTERIQFNGNEYFLVSNSVQITPRSFRQSIKLTRWY